MLSNFELFEQREYERNCTKRISPRKERNNKLLPPECHQIISSSCNKRVSPRRQRGIDCLDFLGSQQQPMITPNQPQSSSNGTRSFTVSTRNNGGNDGSNDGSNGRNGSNGSSTPPQTSSSETVIVVETGSVPSNNQDIEKLQQKINRLEQEKDKLQQELLNCMSPYDQREIRQSSDSSDPTAKPDNASAKGASVYILDETNDKNLNNSSKQSDNNEGAEKSWWDWLLGR